MRFLSCIALLNPKGNLIDDAECVAILAADILAISEIRDDALHLHLFGKPLPADEENTVWTVLRLRSSDKPLYVHHDAKEVLAAIATLNADPSRTVVMPDDITDRSWEPRPPE